MQRKPATSTLRQLAQKARPHLLHSLLVVAVLSLPLVSLIHTQAVSDQQSIACPSNAVGLRPGDNLQNVVNSQAPGSTFCFAAGTYQNQTIRPRTGDVFIGQPGAVMDGGTTTRFAFKSLFEPNSRNPIKNVTIRGLTIQRYASQSSIKGFISPEGAIEGGEGWLIENNIIRDNINGISLGNANWGWGDGSIVRNNQILNNAEVGVEINGSNILFEGNELAGNGWRLSDQDRTWAGGGSKFTDQPVWSDNQFRTTVTRPRTANNHLIIRNNRVHDNVGIGLWLDVYNQFAIIENNVVENNYGSGIMDELNSGTIIRNNTVRNNRKGNSIGGLWGGGEILIANSQKGDVTGNDITVSGTGRAVVMIYESYRSQWPTKDYYVHHNTIRFQNTPQYRSDGDPIAAILGGAGNDPFWTSNNRYDFNTYYVSDPGQKFWFWGQGYNWTDFKGRGHETNGVCFSGSGNTPCTANQAATPTGGLSGSLPTSVVSPTSVTTTATLGPTTTTSSGAGSPYLGQPLAIPGRIETEDFNIGSNGAAYKDNTPGHAENKPVYRTDVVDVDLKPSAYGGFTTGWFEAGEWLNYEVNVTQAGYYDVVLFGGTIENARSLHLEVNGQNITGVVNVPVTAAWTTYTEFTGPRVYLEAGPKTLRLVNDTGFLDVDWIEFRPAAVTATVASPNATVIAPTVVAPTVVLPTAVQPTAVQPTAAQPTVVPPIDEPNVPPATSIPPQEGVAVRAVLSSGSLQPGTAASIDVILDNPQLVAGGGIRALEARCVVAPATVLQGQSVTAGLLFGPDPVTVNAGFQPDNTWVFAVSQSGANPPVSVGGVLFTVGLNTLAAGDAALTCTISIIDGDRATQTLPFLADPLQVLQATATAAPSATPTVMPTATLTTTATATATATVAPSATPTATLTAIATATATAMPPAGSIPTITSIPPTATILPGGSIPTGGSNPPAGSNPSIPRGQAHGLLVRSHGSSDSIEVTVLSTEGVVVAETLTAEDGSFSISDLPAGAYSIRAEAPGYLPAEGPLTIVDGQTTEKVPIALAAGYLVTKPEPAIDELDVVQLASTYGQTSPPVPSSNDLNGDGAVGLPDLSALAENLRTTGPTDWP